MKITNSKNEVYKFTNDEVLEVFIWGYGYADIAKQGLLPIDLENNVKNAELYKKLKQCLENDIEIIQRVRHIWENGRNNYRKTSKHVLGGNHG